MKGPPTREFSKPTFAENCTTDDNYYIYHNLAGRKTIKKTKMSMGTSHKTIGDPLLGQMARQIGVTKPSFLELVDCTLDQAGYEALAFPPKGD